MNIPYKRIEGKDGTLTNPIKVFEPYLNIFPNRQQRHAKQTGKYNSAGTRIIITNLGRGIFIKTAVIKQAVRIKNTFKIRNITHLIERPHGRKL